MLLSELQLGGIIDNALQTHDFLTGHICFSTMQEEPKVDRRTQKALNV